MRGAGAFAMHRTGRSRECLHGSGGLAEHLRRNQAGMTDHAGADKLPCYLQGDTTGRRRRCRTRQNVGCDELQRTGLTDYACTDDPDRIARQHGPRLCIGGGDR